MKHRVAVKLRNRRVGTAHQNFRFASNSGGQCPPYTNSAKSNRDGLTLLEVILAMTIFVGAMAVLSQLVSTGQRATLQSRLQTQAIIRAEAQLNEVLADPALMVSVSNSPFTDEYNIDAPGEWNWSLDVQSWDQNANLLRLELTVVHLSTQGEPNATYTLRRYVRDPQVLLESQTETEEGLY